LLLVSGCGGDSNDLNVAPVEGTIVQPGEAIQDAVDATSPGGTVLVSPRGGAINDLNVAPGEGTIVQPGESIQDAVDAASPGDTILVRPGDYVETHEGRSAVRITKPLKLIADSSPPDQRVRILPSGEQRHGILVEPPTHGDPCISAL